MTGVLVRTGVISLCCGAHHPDPGTASTCRCCAECVTNARRACHSPDVRSVAARAARHLAARERRVWRRVEHALAVEALWDGERDETRHLAAALSHAVRLPAVEYPPVQGRLT